MITARPIDERPRERCLARGPQTLSLRECLAVILGSGPPGKGCLGLAQDLLSRTGQEPGSTEEEQAFFTAMEVAGLTHVSNLPGAGDAAQSRLLAAFELGRRYSIYRESQQNRTGLDLDWDELSTRVLKKIPEHLRHEPQEWLGFIPLFKSTELGELCVVERGVRSHVNTDPAEFFARLLALRPVGFFLVHNHPSGNPTPSNEDVALTNHLNQLARQLGIGLLGHCIVSSSREAWLSPG